MSDEATPVAVETPPPEAAPTETPEAQPEAQPEQVGKPTSKREGRRNALKLARQQAERYARAAEQAARVKDQPRVEQGVPEGGQFKKGEEGQESPPTPEAAADKVPAEPEAVAASTGVPAADSTVEPVEPAEQAPSTEWIDIELEDGHPYRERGKTSIRVRREDEREARAAINAAAKTRDLEARSTELARQNALLEARARALSGEVPDYEKDPMWGLLLKQVTEATGFGEEMANEILEGLRARHELKIRTEMDQATADHELYLVTDRFAAEVESQAPEYFQVWASNGELGQRLHHLMKGYLSKIDEHNKLHPDSPAHPNPNQFFQWAGGAYRGDPRVGAEIRRIQAEDDARKRAQLRQEILDELKTEREKEAKAAADARASLPPTARAVQPSTRAPVAQPSPEGETPARPLTRRDRQRLARETAERLAPTR